MMEEIHPFISGVNSTPEDPLIEQGLFIDDIHRLRILDPSLANQTLQLKSECDSFLSSTKNFDKTVNAFRNEANKTASAVETEKKRAIGYRLILDALHKKKDQDQRQLMSEIDGKRLELERLRVEIEMLQKAEHFHQEILDQLQIFH